jgi:hypothetical protein
VLRYAGLAREAAEECETALRLDPGNYQFRSCQSVFLFTGQFDREQAFASLDAGSEWENQIGIRTLLSQGKKEEALERMRQLPASSFFHTRELEACYATPRPAGSDRILAQLGKEMFAYKDPEPRYSMALQFNSCLGNAFTARLLKSAIDGGYCAYDYLRLDPLAAEFRKSQEYPALLEQARQCQEKFLAERARPQP